MRWICLKENGENNLKKCLKTITVDNGSEFADCTGMERSIFDEKNIEQRYITVIHIAVGNVELMRLQTS